VLGDMPLLPPSYHALSIGFLGRALALLGSEAPSAARALLRRSTDASVALTAPDGTVAYHGRSQEQAWTLPLTAYGAQLAGGSPAYRALAERTIDRLVDAYATGPEGFLVTPSLVQDIDAAIPGIDEYVAGASYVGLTLSSLEWTIAAAGDGPAGRIGADSSKSYVHGRGAGSWATSRSGDVWFAVKRSRTSTRDLRCDVGLVSAKLREGSEWREVIPPRPRTALKDASAGPVLTAGGRSGTLELTELEPGREGRLVGRGGFRTTSGRWVRRGLTFTFAPTKCGVRLSFRGLKGDRYVYTGFFRGEPRREDGAIRDETQSIETDSPPKLSTGGSFASGADVRLHGGIARWKRAKAGTVSVEVCAR